MDGCGALEVALDSYGAMEVLSELAQVLPSSCVVGAATVMTEKAARKAAQAGARFITSPVNPPNFIGWCDSEEVLAIPGGLTPTELYFMLASGAKAVKLFPACTFTPAGLKQVATVGMQFHAMIIMIDSDVIGADAQRGAIPRC
jgi:2-keto-3-deoxy-6-phosphogluconate aldolase